MGLTGKTLCLLKRASQTKKKKKKGTQNADTGTWTCIQTDTKNGEPKSKVFSKLLSLFSAIARKMVPLNRKLS